MGIAAWQAGLKNIFWPLIKKMLAGNSLSLFIFEENKQLHE